MNSARRKNYFYRVRFSNCCIWEQMITELVCSMKQYYSILAARISSAIKEF